MKVNEDWGCQADQKKHKIVLNLGFYSHTNPL